ncbi:flagellar protein FlaG [Candidatus Contubernalis alkaliaceticus]|uniref:flagellar protein FlaG n=1 Tax=Candidatus Contubernalis alkaliaceticus TaxID=338645 RepID=UPI001F4BF615|nr:flagellar protein FlaG [Candidatus Contubernalis alkalaceticus]UNC91739.1 flagellar protein FlaG [Candidatus Contubernalis alkalaceticus]
MKIDGTDPLTLNKIKDQTQKLQVQSSGEVFTDTQMKNRQETIRGKNTPREENQNYNERLESAVKQANETAEAVNLSLRFEIHESSQRVMVRVVNLAEDEVIKEIPPEKVLNLVGQIQEMIGLMLDEKR